MIKVELTMSNALAHTVAYALQKAASEYAAQAKLYERNGWSTSSEQTAMRSVDLERVAQTIIDRM